ncbi:DUF6075 family protein [Caloranaerobacter ferrireducens]|uniref:DUF6075 family protein n=1 Tax=Caloranaerobacter ferrireducens TaxID=1323370 RepID=UPI00084D488D|nr:DUF6075 family protein [Caloranaerobacter ferrireducens]
MNFLNQSHKNRFNTIISKDGTDLNDLNRKSLFYIISGNDELFNNRYYIYDLDKRWIAPDNLEQVNFIETSLALIELAYNLYNNFSSGSISNIFKGLDKDNFKLAIKGLKIRFNMDLE